jgi:LmbE family N-acetylglucosaminyl deacetylase
MKVLLIGAHPDDEVLGCGGTIARLVQEGHEAYIAILGEGITARYASRDKAHPKELAQLHEKARAAAKTMGAKDVALCNLPDNRFDTVPLLEIAKTVEGLLERFDPDVVYTHHEGDLNIDHVITHRAVLTASRPNRKCRIKRVYAFEIPSSTEWAFQAYGSGFHANVFVDISKTLNLKICALEMYDSEVCEFPHPRSRKAVQAYAWRWGSVVGLEAAEAFELVRAIE